MLSVGNVISKRFSPWRSSRSWGCISLRTFDGVMTGKKPSNCSRVRRNSMPPSSVFESTTIAGRLMLGYAARTSFLSMHRVLPRCFKPVLRGLRRAVGWVSWDGAFHCLGRDRRKNTDENLRCCRGVMANANSSSTRSFPAPIRPWVMAWSTITSPGGGYAILLHNSMATLHDSSSHALIKS